MPIYLSFKSVPELAAKGEAERKAIIKEATSLAVKHWECWLSLLAAGALCAVGAWLGGRGISGALGAGLGGALGSALFQLTVVYVARKHHASVLGGQKNT